MIICKVSTQSKKLFRREIVRWDDGSSSSYPQRQQAVITIEPESSPLRPDVNRLYDMIVPSVKIHLQHFLFLLAKASIAGGSWHLGGK